MREARREREDIDCFNGESEFFAAKFGGLLQLSDSEVIGFVLQLFHEERCIKSRGTA
jgi:hypothetical protein